MSETSEEENVCAICWDEFSHPKILPCRHTFCKACLKGYQKKTSDFEEIKCPVCRQTHTLDERGLDSFLDNYFVHLRPSDQPEMLCCSICYEEAILKTCSHCSEKHCPSCRKSHTLALRIAGESYEHGSDSESDKNETEDFVDRDITDEASVPFHLMFSGQTIRTQFNAKLVSAFKTGSMTNSSEEDQQPPIYTLFQNGKDRILVVLDTGPEIVEYKEDGTETNRFMFPCRISDIIMTPTGRTLFVNPGDPFVLEITLKQIYPFAPCKGCRPICLAPFNDGRIVVTGFAIPSTQDEETEEGERERKGMLLLYDKTGKLLKEVKEGTDGPVLRFPMNIAVSHINNKICVADQDLKCVLIFSDTCDLLARYDAGQSTRRMGLFWNPREFVPFCLCHDPEGNIIVPNTVDSLIHVLNPDGNFLGYILTRDKEGFGHPAGIMMDPTNSRIWLGDRIDGKIRIYEISSYKNSFNQQDMYNPYNFRLNFD
ncbi:uncharacterized protein LOC134259982 [Saccostrea cucullata]|uniref:uncharacterized protein LOC134259982 n=1 Tax=Saccostrea cuccullata TaxID=36930 RepID=UPI002ED018BA